MCLFDLYLVVLTLSLTLKVASLVTDTDAWKICSNSLTLWAFWTVLDSEYDLETQLGVYQLIKRNTWKGTR